MDAEPGAAGVIKRNHTAKHSQFPPSEKNWLCFCANFVAKLAIFAYLLFFCIFSLKIQYMFSLSEMIAKNVRCFYHEKNV